MKDNSGNSNLTDQFTYSEVTEKLNHVYWSKPKNDKDSDSTRLKTKYQSNRLTNRNDWTIGKNNNKWKLGDNNEVQEPQKLSSWIIMTGISKEEKEKFKS